MSKHTVLVSGASGFLGKELVRQLLDKDEHRVIGLTSRPDILIKHFDNEPNLSVFNVNNWTKEIDKSTNIDVFVNCAFPRSSEPEKLAEGLDFTKTIIQEGVNLNVSRIINISSQSVYSQKDKTTPDETDIVAPESLYGMAKYAAEKVVISICESTNKNIHYSNIRLASLTGIELEARMTNKFVKHALDGEKIIVNGRGQKVSYLDVRDAASALLAMISKESISWKKVYNLGNHHYCSVLEIAESVNNVARKYGIPEIEIVLTEGQDNFNNLINSELFYNDFDWKPYYDIPLMVDDLFSHYIKYK